MQHVAEVENAGNGLGPAVLHHDIGGIQVVVHDLRPQARQAGQDQRLGALDDGLRQGPPSRVDDLRQERSDAADLANVPEEIAAARRGMEEAAQGEPEPRQEAAEIAVLRRRGRPP